MFHIHASQLDLAKSKNPVILDGFSIELFTLILLFQPEQYVLA